MHGPATSLSTAEGWSTALCRATNVWVLSPTWHGVDTTALILLPHLSGAIDLELPCRRLDRVFVPCCYGSTMLCLCASAKHVEHRRRLVPQLGWDNSILKLIFVRPYLNTCP